MLKKTGVFALWLVACLALPSYVGAQEEETATEEATTEEAPPPAEEAPAAEPAPEPEPEPEPAVEPAPVEAAAATAPAVEAAEEEAPEEIVVTGTRIKRKSLATAAPVTVLTKDDLLNAGMMSIGEILQNLPSNSNAINVQFNNGGDGSTRIDMRGIGSARTLVLVNGRRHVYGGTGANASVDLNAIPISVVERVEVLKDGASAIYGSDAIGGVVNIITKKDFVGVEAIGYAGVTQRGDGRVYDISATTGMSSEKGNIIFSANFFDQTEIWAGDRDFSKNDKAYEWDDDDRAQLEEDTGLPYYELGSSATPQGTIIDRLEEPGNAAWQAIHGYGADPDDPDDDTGACASGFCYNDPDAGWRDFNSNGNSDSARPETAGDYYNYQPENYLLTPQRRLSLWTSGNYELSEWFNTFFEASYTNRRSVQTLAPTPLFIISEGITVDSTNRYNPYGRDFIDIRRRMVEAKNRIYSQNLHTYRLVMGVEGPIPEIGPLADWTWDFNVNFGRTEGVQINEGRFVRSRVERALGPDADCTGDCVPLNLFGGPGTITQEMLDYISYTGVARGYSEQRIAALNLGGPIYELVEGFPIAFAAGYQYRREAGGYQPDPNEASGDTTGNKGEAVKGRYDQHAGFFELSLPVVGDLPGVELFELSAAMRFFDYSTFGSDLTYKFGARWQITDWLAARGTYSTAFRAPSVNELFSGQSDSFPNVTDPCDNTGGPLDPAIDALCQADGLPAGGIATGRSQEKTRVGGNPNLDPEKATIITGGIVLEDKLVKGLSAAVDYWNIDIDDAIQPLGAGVILSSCYPSEGTERKFCELITRLPSGLIDSISDISNNVGGVKTSGVDFDLRYSHGTPIGRFGASVEGTLLIDYVQIDPTGYEWSFKNNYDGAGASSVSNGGVYPGWKANATLLWVMDRYNAGVNFRFIPGFKECPDDDLCNAERDEGADPPPSRDVESNFTMDLFAGVNFESFLGQTDLTIGVNNLTDQDPSVIYTGFLATSDASTYDFMGRYFYVRLGQKF